MTNPKFLIQDSSWRTFPISWGADFNNALNRASDSAPPFSSPFSTKETEQYRLANDNGLRLLDSRQIDIQGNLPGHMCGMAFWIWADAEERLIKEQANHSNLGAKDESFVFLDNLLYAWRCIFKFNLASLALVDATAPSAMRAMVKDQFSETLGWLQNALEFEPAIEKQLAGIPSPTRQVRYAVEQALGT